MCKHCDGLLHPDMVVSACVAINSKCQKINRLCIFNESRHEVLYIDNEINFCPVCGRNLAEAK